MVPRQHLCHLQSTMATLPCQILEGELCPPQSSLTAGARRSGTQSSGFKELRSEYRRLEAHPRTLPTQGSGEMEGEEERLSLEREPQSYSHSLPRGPCLGVLGAAGSSEVLSRTVFRLGLRLLHVFFVLRLATNRPVPLRLPHLALKQ